MELAIIGIDLFKDIPVPLWVIIILGIIFIILLMYFLLNKVRAGFEDTNGFHSCPDYCNKLLGENIALRKQLGEKLEQLKGMLTREIESLENYRNNPPKVEHQGIPLPETSEASEKIGTVILPPRKATQREENELYRKQRK